MYLFSRFSQSQTIYPCLDLLQFITEEVLMADLVTNSANDCLKEHRLAVLHFHLSRISQ